jgi:hypothetical protein
MFFALTVSKHCWHQQQKKRSARSYEVNTPALISSKNTRHFADQIFYFASISSCDISILFTNNII